MSRKAWMFPEYRRSWKVRSENLRLRSTWRPFDSSFEPAERSVSDGGNLCSLWSVILKSVWNSVGDTFQLRYLLAVSCYELYFTRCCAMKRTGTFASESKVMCLFYLILRSGVLMFRIPNINQCVKKFLRLRKVEFIKWINLMNVLFIGFVKQ